MSILKLSGSVGSGISKNGIPHNEASDIKKIKERFVELGYESAPITDKKLIHLIKFFQCICKGAVRVNSGDGRIDLHGNTHRWLAAHNAPGWVNMLGKKSWGYEVVKVDYDNSYATTWMRDRLALAGLQYLLFSSGKVPPMWVRDFSKKTGGKTRGHGSHQTGLNVDMRLPTIGGLKYDHDYHFHDGEASPAKFGLEKKTYNELFDRDTARQQLKAIKNMMNTKVILFNDKALRGEGLCKFYNNHGGHYHITIRPPERIEGSYK